DPSMIPRAAEELLRRFPIVADARMVARDTEYEGVTLKKGDMIQVPTVYSGLDESLNDDPWTVDFHRRRPLHNTFGDGPHRCAGMHLARMEIAITLKEWIARIPEFRLGSNAKPEYASGMVATVKGVPLEWDV
ncbi:MAG: cytochrome P450, partial [Alteraurantiacibacter sp.]